MLYRPHIVELLETGLVEPFRFRDELGSFISRSDVARPQLAAARERTEERNKRSQRGVSHAPKRLVPKNC